MKLNILGLNTRNLFSEKNKSALEILLKQRDVDIALINETGWEKEYQARFPGYTTYR